MIKVSCVSYLNSQPFIHGLKNHPVREEIDLSLDIPSVCADKLQSGVVDIGLIPIALIPDLPEHYLISDYCIGADGEVDTVLLVSDVPLSQIKTIYLDGQSRTSVLLAQVLATLFWKIKPQWKAASGDFSSLVRESSAGVFIGDKTFALKGLHPYTLDLASEWKKFTAESGHNAGLPFVFACWVANKKLPAVFIQRFNEALAKGLEARKAISMQVEKDYPGVDISDYLQNKISYSLDDAKRKAMKLFQDYVQDIRQFKP